MKILVTGGTGFTGRALVSRLLNDGHQVVALDHKEGLGTDDLRARGADVILGSVTDRETVNQCMKGVEVVHHLAAAYREVNAPPQHFYNINFKGTKNVAEAAINEGVRKMIHCSSCGVHGSIARPPGNEETPIDPVDYSDRTIYQGEAAARDYAAQGLHITVLRPAAIYGPGDPARFLMIFRRLARGRFPMLGNGRTLYHPLFVENLVDAFLLAQQNGRGDGESYLIADEEYLSIEELVRRIGRVMGVDVKFAHYPMWPVVAAGHAIEAACKPFGLSPPLFPRRIDWYRQNRAFSIDKAKLELGYQPRISLDEGLREAYAWYRKEGYL
jgi:nucleoside-diphosphate-sugar epimerase